MPTPPLSDEEALAALEAVRRHGGVGPAAQALGLAPSTLRSRTLVAARRGLDLAAPSEKYRVREGHAIRAESALLDDEGRIVQRWIKTREEADREADFLEAVQDALSRFRPVAPISPPAAADADLCTLIPIADAHVGMRAWGRETGESYDLDIARQVMTETAGHLLGTTPSSDTAILLFLGDYLHADDQSQQTPRSGHQLDVDGRHHKVLLAAVELALALVGMTAARHQRVIVRCLPGNHDPTMTAALTVALHAAFREDPRIEVDTAPGNFWFFEWGASLIGATHGHTIKQAEMPLTMAASVPDAWGRTRYRLFLSGHIHHQRSIEQGGVICRSFPAISARDSYAASRGLYAHRGMVALHFHREDGPCGEITRYLPAARFEAAA